MVSLILLPELLQAPLFVCFLLHSSLLFASVSPQSGWLGSRLTIFLRVNPDQEHSTVFSVLSPCLSHETVKVTVKVRACEKRWAGAKDSPASRPGTWAGPGSSEPLVSL